MCPKIQDIYTASGCTKIIQQNIILRNLYMPTLQKATLDNRVGLRGYRPIGQFTIYMPTCIRIKAIIIIYKIAWSNIYLRLTNTYAKFASTVILYVLNNHRLYRSTLN